MGEHKTTDAYITHPSTHYAHTRNSDTRNNWKAFFPRTNVFWLYYLFRTMSNDRVMRQSRDVVGSASHQLESLISILIKSHSARDAVSRILSASNLC